MQEPPPDPALGPTPVLRNLAVDFETAFTIDNVDRIPLKFWEFGFEVRAADGSLKPLPHFTYVIDRATPVISPMDGVVHGVRRQEQDYAIWLKPHGAPTLWLVELDHVVDVAVAEGDQVATGDFLGYPGGGGTLGALELMVNGPQAHVCPFEVFDPGAAADLQARIADFMEAWDTARWDLPQDHPRHPAHPSGQYRLYSSVEMVVPGCRTREMPFPR